MKERIQNFIRVFAAFMVVDIFLFFMLRWVIEYEWAVIVLGVPFLSIPIALVLAIFAFFKITFKIPYAQIVRWGIVVDTIIFGIEMLNNMMFKWYSGKIEREKMLKERFWNLMFLCGMFPSLFFLLFIGLFWGMGTIMFLAVILGYTFLEIFVLKIESDPMYFMPGNDITEILNIPYAGFLVLYILFMIIYINAFYLIDGRKNIFKKRKNNLENKPINN